MASRAQLFLTPAEQEKVTRAVQEAEKQTSGEIVPMIVSESHRYPLAAVSGAAFISLPLALLITQLIGSHFWVGPHNMWLFLACFMLLFVLFHQLVQNVSWLKKRFLSPRRVKEEVRDGAIRAFFRKELYRTKAQNGIILYISVFERQVWILGDSGINEKIPQERWQEIVDSVTQGIRENRQGEVICDAVTRIGDMLKEFFPYKKDDTDELHNLIID